MSNPLADAGLENGEPYRSLKAGDEITYRGLDGLMHTEKVAEIFHARHVFVPRDEDNYDDLSCELCGLTLTHPSHETDPEFTRLFGLLRETMSGD